MAAHLTANIFESGPMPTPWKYETIDSRNGPLTVEMACLLGIQNKIQAVWDRIQMQLLKNFDSIVWFLHFYIALIDQLHI